MTPRQSIGPQVLVISCGLYYLCIDSVTSFAPNVHVPQAWRFLEFGYV